MVPIRKEIICLPRLLLKDVYELGLLMMTSNNKVLELWHKLLTHNRARRDGWLTGVSAAVRLTSQMRSYFLNTHLPILVQRDIIILSSICSRCEFWIRDLGAYGKRLCITIVRLWTYVARQSVICESMNTRGTMSRLPDRMELLASLALDCRLLSLILVADIEHEHGLDLTPSEECD